METLSQFVLALGATGASPSELDRFLVLLGTAPDAESRRNALAHLLRAVPLSPEQTLFLAKAAPVASDGSLQLLLKRYVRAQQFAASNAAEKQRLSSPWATSTEAVKAVLAVLSFVPPVG